MHYYWKHTALCWYHVLSLFRICAFFSFSCLKYVCAGFTCIIVHALNACNIKDLYNGARFRQKLHFYSIDHTSIFFICSVQRMQKGLGVYIAHCREQPKKPNARSQYEDTVASSINTNRTNQYKRRSTRNEPMITAVIAQEKHKKCQQIKCLVASRSRIDGEKGPLTWQCWATRIVD